MANPYVDAGIAAGLPPALAGYMPRYVHIESGGNQNARTGSYTGVLQMGPSERAQYGGNDLAAGARMYADKYNWFKSKYGRDPSPTELYMVNQQGQGGLAAHMANPDGLAWRNMAQTAEGQQKGDAWAKKAIWGNVPDDVKANYPGGVDSLTSRQFMDLWNNKVLGGTTQPFGGIAQPFNPTTMQAPQAPAWSPFAVPDLSGAIAQAPAAAAAGAPSGGFLGGILPDSITSMFPSAQQQQQQGGLFPSLSSLTAGTPLSGVFAQPQQGAQQSGGYMPQMPQPQQLQAPQINYYQPRMAQLQLPQMAPFRF